MTFKPTRGREVLPFKPCKLGVRAFEMTTLGKDDAHGGFVHGTVFDSKGVCQHLCTIVRLACSLVNPFDKPFTACT